MPRKCESHTTGGFTTFKASRSSGRRLRDSINKGEREGRAFSRPAADQQRSGDPEKIREIVRQVKQEGGDVIKLFATAAFATGASRP